MAFAVVTDAATGVGTSSATLNGHCSGMTPPPYAYTKFLYGYGSPTNETAVVLYNDEPTYFSHVLSGLDSDRTIAFDARARDAFIGGFVGGGELNFKTLAPLMTFGTPGSSNITITTAKVNIDFNPNTWESLANIEVWYRVKTGPGAWVSGGVISNESGFTIRNLLYNLSGLAAFTTYQFEFRATRNTANDTSLTSTPLGEFTTLGNPVEINIAETITPSETITTTKNSNFQFNIAETITTPETVELIVGKGSIPALIQPIMSGSSVI